ncbi:hypothetical protein [Maritimibacter sp. HL-12]|uniref:hypothetical protein n=1 Tax=Maritimibacter sp. HL-12 TaxID=1162418 RepID=UPI000A0EFADA|nr:hypothetical protein [Maritimibacter sp. HL-12]SMH50823.1 hypothetical protein SAMN05661107_2378 [Maritimibacter sp. HL-12]
MKTSLENLRARAREIEAAVEEEVDRRREALGARLERGRVVFEADVRARHRAARQKLGDYVRGIRPAVVLSAPVIYSLILPLALVDLWVTLYQRICFPVYGIARVKRREFIVIDRHRLGYLNTLEKINCVYCGYAGGVIAYAREVASRTEAHWCPIKHARRWPGAHARYGGFMDYGDETDFIARWAAERARLKNEL